MIYCWFLGSGFGGVSKPATPSARPTSSRANAIRPNLMSPAPGIGITAIGTRQPEYKPGSRPLSKPAPRKIGSRQPTKGDGDGWDETGGAGPGGKPVDRPAGLGRALDDPDLELDQGWGAHPGALRRRRPEARLQPPQSRHLPLPRQECLAGTRLAQRAGRDQELRHPDI